MDEARRVTAFFPEVRKKLDDAVDLYREGEWAQQRGECELSAQRGLDAEAAAKEARALHDHLAAALSPEQTVEMARADIQAASEHVQAQLSPKAAKNLQEARDKLVESRAASDPEKKKALALEASGRGISAWKLYDLALTGQIDSEMAKAKIVLDEAEKSFGKSVQAGERERHREKMDQAELWIKVAHFDVQESDPPEVAEFSMKAIQILKGLSGNLQSALTPAP